LPRFDKPSPGFFFDNSPVVLFVELHIYNTVVLADRIWNELLPPHLPAELQHATRQPTIGVAPRHTEQFVYIRVTDENLEAIARYVALCALTYQAKTTQNPSEKFET
jgi:hypothetical protein